jgi:hypothetical protein
MSAPTESWQTKRARYAAKRRHEPDGDHSAERDDVLRARREARIAELITTAPALQPEQVERLRHLLPPSPPHPSSAPSRREAGGDST